MGNPSIAYKWFKNQVEVVNQTFILAINNVLYIHNIDSTDHLDKYTCGIYNEALDEPLKAHALLNVNCEFKKLNFNS